MTVQERSPLVTQTPCPDCGSPKAIMAYERVGKPVYFCRECERTREMAARGIGNTQASRLLIRSSSVPVRKVSGG